MSDQLSRQFEESRARLRAIARRMLGSAADADDAVQEVWLRLHRATPERIDNLGGWLTTVVSRVCLDMLRARTRRREDVQGADHLVVAVEDGTAVAVGAAIEDADSPEADVLLAESIGPALVLVLDTLEPHERLAFVLHDLFGVPYSQIAAILGRSTAATRQLASRARRRIRGGAPSRRAAAGHGATTATTTASATTAAATTASATRQSELVEAFLAASRRGDFEALVALLDPDVVLRVDAVAVRAAARRRAQGAPAFSEELHGREAVAGVLCGSAAAAQPALVDGMPGAVWAPGGEPRTAFLVRSRDGRITEIEVVADPRRVRELEVVL